MNKHIYGLSWTVKRHHLYRTYVFGRVIRREQLNRVDHLYHQLLTLEEDDLRLLSGSKRFKVWHAIERIQRDPEFLQMLETHEGRKRAPADVPSNNQLRALLTELRAS